MLGEVGVPAGHQLGRATSSAMPRMTKFITLSGGQLNRWPGGMTPWGGSGARSASRARMPTGSASAGGHGHGHGNGLLTGCSAGDTRWPSAGALADDPSRPLGLGFAEAHEPPPGCHGVD